MNILHISDIHFQHPDCLDLNTDPEQSYRTRLLQDAETRFAALGRADAILVTGDIAFKGHPEEYRIAKTWLQSLAIATNCPSERVFVVPGNHDVDRSVVKAKASVRNTHAAILGAQSASREREFRTQIADADAGKSLFASMEAYNEFAKFFGCQIYAPDRFFWRQDVAIGSGVTLRIHGLTSTLLSGVNGQNDTKGQLYISPLQTVFDPNEDVVHLAMAHHPPDWCLDHDEFDDALNDRAKLHLFGHKHRQRIQLSRDHVRFSAGATNPERNEPGWQPGYNIVTLSIHGIGADRKLQVDTHLLEYQSNPEGFRSRKDGMSDVFYHTISIPQRSRPMPASTSATLAVPSVTPVPMLEVSVSDESTRSLLDRFWDLTSSQRREITLKLGLITQQELSDPEPERYGRALIRAGERKQVEALDQEVKKLIQ